MKTIETYNEQLAGRSSFTDLVENAKPVTASGLKFISEWKSISESNVFEKSASAILNRFVEAASKIKDPAVRSIREELIEIMSETRLATSLAIIGESTKNSENELHVAFNNVIEGSLIGESEESIKESVKSGALSAFGGIGGVSDIVNMCKSTTVKTSVNDFTVSNPISYVEESSNGVFFRLGQSVLQLDENTMSLANSPSAVFSHMSNIVENVPFNSEAGYFIAETDFGTFHISANHISHVEKDRVTEMSTQEFIHNASVVVEANTTNTITRQHAANNRAYVDAIAALADHFDDVKVLDTVTVAEHSSGRESIMFTEHVGSFYVAVLESFRQPKTFKKFASVSEAIHAFKKLTSIDVSESYVTAIASESTISSKKLEQAAVINNRLISVTEKLSTISAEIELVEQGSDSYVLLSEAYSKTIGLQSELNKSLLELHSAE